MSTASVGATDWDAKQPVRVAHSVTEVATMFGLSEASIWRGIKRGQFECIRVGGRTLITDRSVQKTLTPQAA